MEIASDSLCNSKVRSIAMGDPACAHASLLTPP